MRGIELNPYAAELARVSVWIGEIQWMRANGFDASRNPILRPLDTIECRDAILNEDGTRAEWPEADVVVGNPPFLGGKDHDGSLGDAYDRAHPQGVDGRVRPGSRISSATGSRRRAIRSCTAGAQRAGLVATNSIAKSTNLPVLRRIAGDLTIFDAGSTSSGSSTVPRCEFRWSASRRTRPLRVRTLNGAPVGTINPT